MKIFIEYYPSSFVFSTRKKLPKFKYGCKTRTEILHKFLEKNPSKNETPHNIKDFIVEIVERPWRDSNDEVWTIGS